jgi:sugar lactone lactonase YvrE
MRGSAMSVSVSGAELFLKQPSEEDRFLPEGPRIITVSGRKALAWVNIQTAVDSREGSIHLRFLDDGETRTLPQTDRPGFLLPTDREATVLVGRGKQLGTVNLRTNEWTLLDTIPDTDKRTIINDGEIVPGGAGIVFGTKDTQFREPIAHLYLYTLADGKLTTLLGGQTCSNGKVFVRDGNGLLLYDIDTPRRQVVRYRLDLNERRLEPLGVAIDLTSTPGFPDGMADCGDDTVVIAFYNPDPISDGKAARYRLGDGALLEEWTVPGSPRVTCPLIFEHEGKPKLLLTTATEGMPTEQRNLAPSAGDLFVAAIDLKAIPKSEAVRLGATRTGNTWVLVAMGIAVFVSLLLGGYMYLKRGSGEVVDTLFQKFIPPHGSCSVDFPMTPTMEILRFDRPLFQDGDRYTSYRWFERVTFSITWVNLDPERAKKSALTEVVDEFRSWEEGRSLSKPVRASPLSLKAGNRVFEGVEHEYQTDEGTTVRRYYFERGRGFNRLYVLEASGKNLKADGATAVRFFNSFKPVAISP